MTDADRANTDEALYVLDTKCKAAFWSASADIEQVVTYVESKGCCEAVLVYPISLPKPQCLKIGDTRVRSLAFSIGSHPGKAGQVLIHDLLQTTSSVPSSSPGRATLLRLYCPRAWGIGESTNICRHIRELHHAHGGDMQLL